MDSNQQDFNSQQGLISYQRVFKYPSKTPLAVPAGFYFGVPSWRGSSGSTIQSSCPNGRKLLTLRDAAEYITGLPKARA